MGTELFPIGFFEFDPLQDFDLQISKGDEEYAAEGGHGLVAEPGGDVVAAVGGKGHCGYVTEALTALCGTPP